MKKGSTKKIKTIYKKTQYVTPVVFFYILKFGKGTEQSLDGESICISLHGTIQCLYQYQESNLFCTEKVE